MRTILATALLCGCSLFAMASNGGGDPKKDSSKVEETSKSTRMFSYLQVTKSDIAEGDTYVLSTIVEVDVESWGHHQDEVLHVFESELEKRFPGTVFTVGYDAVQGMFNSKIEAEQYQRQTIKNKVNQQQKATTVKLNISLVD